MLLKKRRRAMPKKSTTQMRSCSLKSKWCRRVVTKMWILICLRLTARLLVPPTTLKIIRVSLSFPVFEISFFYLRILLKLKWFLDYLNNEDAHYSKVDNFNSQSYLREGTNSHKESKKSGANSESPSKSDNPKFSLHFNFTLNINTSGIL